MTEDQDENPAKSPPSFPDQMRITSEREAAHALAYIHFGMDFVYVSAVEGYTAVPRRRIDGWQSAVISLAGPCVELRYLSQRFGATEGMTRMLHSWQETVEYDDYDEGEGEGDHDVMNTHGYISAALPVAHALVEDNAKLIHELGAAILRSDRVSFDQAMTVLGHRRTTLQASTTKCSLALFAPHAERLRAIDIAVTARM